MHWQIIITGPRTQLARSLLQTPELKNTPCILVARHEEEAALLEQEFPQHPRMVWKKDVHWPALPEGIEKIVVFACALGPIHPLEHGVERDQEDLRRDLLLAHSFCHAYPGVPLYVQFVSTILAHVNRPDVYGGAKGVVEGCLSEWIGQRPGAELAVLYPGHIVHQRSWRRPWQLLFTPYPTLARYMFRKAVQGHARRWICGKDSRIWMLYRSAMFFVEALTGRVRKGVSGPPATNVCSPPQPVPSGLHGKVGVG